MNKDKELRKFLSTSLDNFQQQTFLGCTVKDFNANGGFGDSVSTLHVELVPDEYNKSDETNLGDGDDVYHNGKRDIFIPPNPGTPVFFKFGSTFSSVEQAWMPEFDYIYGTKLTEGLKKGWCKENCSKFATDSINEEECLENCLENIGKHFIFGGIIQEYGQKSDTNGDPMYHVTVNDPREILGNVTLILNNYANSVFGLPNIMNVYGFLEHNPSNALRNAINNYYGPPSPYIFEKIASANGISYSNGLQNLPLLTDSYITPTFLQAITPNLIPTRFVSLGDFPHIFPYTGISFSRRKESGIPVYRIVQAIFSMMGVYGPLPLEYQLKNYGGVINFRGFNYIVDFSGIPFFKIPPSYMLDFDQMTLLEFLQEICDVISHDLSISLLPVINHPATAIAYNYNEEQIKFGNNRNIIAGVIRVNSIDRSHKPEYGAITRFITEKKNAGVNVSSADIGVELSNITTDKFIVGAQEVNMHFFTTNGDRHKLELRKWNYGISDGFEFKPDIPEQWFISNSLRQQVLPFYGFLGSNAVTIPRGYGPYQQILLDATGLNANGVGNYYVATQMELRAALVSIEDWKEFLLKYNDLYMEEVSSSSLGGVALNSHKIDKFYRDNTAKAGEVKEKYKYSKWAVSVPRCVFASDRNYFTKEGWPASSCSPPYGWPLYYKRAEMIGLPDKGIAMFKSSSAILIQNLRKISNESRITFEIRNNIITELMKDLHKMNQDDQNIIWAVITKLQNNEIDEVIGIVRNYQETKFNQAVPSRELKKRTANAMKIYEFVKQAAQNLGIKWLVKIPKVSNPFYAPLTTINSSTAAINRIFEIEYGPYGFIPRDALGNISSENLSNDRIMIDLQFMNKFNIMLSYGAEASALPSLRTWSISTLVKTDLTNGALKSTFDPINETHVFNYEPEPQGGFLQYDLYSNILNAQQYNVFDRDNYPVSLRSALFPIDPSNLINDGRVSAYVRFDNSQYLDFSTLPKESYTQIKVDGNSIIPDIILDLDNQNQDKMTTDMDIGTFRATRGKTCAFVKCEIDEKFYMPPKYDIFIGPFQGDIINQTGYIKAPAVSFDKKTGEDVVGTPDYIIEFEPVPSGGNEITPSYRRNASGNLITEEEIRSRRCLQEDFIRFYDPVLNGNIIFTDPLNQDTNHVYALITLPGFVGNNIDRKFEQSQLETRNADVLSHILFEDVVSDQIPGFEYPVTRQIKDRPTAASYGDSISGPYRNDKIFALNGDPKNLKTQARRETYAISLKRKNVTAPCPVMPDLVALPLRSKERCYGPWISSFTNLEAAQQRRIPGKIEFIKDENLAPWNYGGHDLMNEAAITLSQFGNSLLPYEEKGNITFEGLPNGNSLMRPLIEGGPLVTNVDVRIGTDGVTTTYNMSTYSPRFGNLQKQRSDLISKLSRDRQKLMDDRNEYLRKGLGKTRQAFSDVEFMGINALSTMSQNLVNSIDRTKYQQQVSSENRIANGHTPDAISVNSNVQTSFVNNAINPDSPVVREDVPNNSAPIIHNIASNIPNSTDPPIRRREI